MCIEQNVLIDRLSGREEVKERRFLALATKSRRMPHLQSGVSSIIKSNKGDVPFVASDCVEIAFTEQPI
jgi:hypothetical protein